MSIESQIIETWNINNRINIFMIENIPGEAFSATLSQRGGRTVAQQLGHVNNVRLMWMDSFIKKNNLSVLKFEKDAVPDKKMLLNAFKQSGEAGEKFIQSCIDNDGKAPGFKRGIIPMLGYFISHEAHHRGNILLTIKQCGFKIPENFKWEMWEWEKI